MITSRYSAVFRMVHYVFFSVLTDSVLSPPPKFRVKWNSVLGWNGFCLPQPHQSETDKFDTNFSPTCTKDFLHRALSRKDQQGWNPYNSPSINTAHNNVLRCDLSVKDPGFLRWGHQPQRVGHHLIIWPTILPPPPKKNHVNGKWDASLLTNPPSHPVFPNRFKSTTC